MALLCKRRPIDVISLKVEKIYLGNPGKRLANRTNQSSISSSFFLQLISFITFMNLIFSAKIKSRACRKERKFWLSGNVEI